MLFQIHSPWLVVRMKLENQTFRCPEAERQHRFSQKLFSHAGLIILLRAGPRMKVLKLYIASSPIKCSQQLRKWICLRCCVFTVNYSNFCGTQVREHMDGKNRFCARSLHYHDFVFIYYSSSTEPRVFNTIQIRTTTTRK